MALLLSIIFCLFLLVIYFMPSFIALARKHTYVLQIVLLNALLGWSFFGWAAALIWSTTNHTDENVSTKLPWVIISIFAIAILFPVIFFFGIFSFVKPEKIEIKTPHMIEKVQYKTIYYSFPPQNETKDEKIKSNEMQNKKDTDRD